MMYETSILAAKQCSELLVLSLVVTLVLLHQFSGLVYLNGRLAVCNVE